MLAKALHVPTPHDDESFLGATLSLRIGARLADAVRASVLVEALARAANWPESSAFHVSLAVEELCTAIIENPRPDAVHDGEILLEVRAEEGAVTVEVMHEGPPFNALVDEAPMELIAPVEEGMGLRLGVRLVVSMMDDWDYLREARRNRVMVVKRTDRD